MRQVIGLSVVLALSLVGSYLSWTSDEEVIDDDAVVVVQHTAKELTSLEWDSEDSTTVISRRSDDLGDYLWIESTVRTKKRKAPELDRSTPGEGEGTEGEGADGEASEGEGAEDAGGEAPEAAEPEGAEPEGAEPEGAEPEGEGEAPGEPRWRSRPRSPTSRAAPRPTRCGTTSLPFRSPAWRGAVTSELAAPHVRPTAPPGRRPFSLSDPTSDAP